MTWQSVLSAVTQNWLLALFCGFEKSHFLLLFAKYLLMKRSTQKKRFLLFLTFCSGSSRRGHIQLKIQWSSISCRLRYQSKMIACCVFSHFKITFIKHDETFFIQDNCCELMSCLHLMEPNNESSALLLYFNVK